MSGPTLAQARTIVMIKIGSNHANEATVDHLTMLVHRLAQIPAATRRREATYLLATWMTDARSKTVGELARETAAELETAA